MTSETRTYAEFLASTDREDERLRIEEYGDRQREKWPADPVLPPGIERRRHRDWFEVMAEIADIQSKLSGLGDLFSSRAGIRVMMLVWPKLMDPRAITGPPAIRRRIRAARKARGVGDDFYSFFMMATAKYPLFPVISVRHRKAADTPEFAQSRAIKQRNEITSEIIGRAVLQDYRQSGSIESSWSAVAAMDDLDGVRPGGESNVKRRYLEYRKLAFERGYADNRAVWAQYEGAPWPHDQVWLDDFPK